MRRIIMFLVPGIVIFAALLTALWVLGRPGRFGEFESGDDIVIYDEITIKGPEIDWGKNGKPATVVEKSVVRHLPGMHARITTRNDDGSYNVKLGPLFIAQGVVKPYGLKRVR